MATIKIHRTNEYINRLRNYRLYIDGHYSGTIARGETKDFEMTSGHHSILAKIDWCRSGEYCFDINDNEVKTFSIGAFKNSNLFLLLSFGIIALAIILKITLDFKYFGFISGPVILILFYYLTFGFKKYLTIKELETI